MASAKFLEEVLNTDVDESAVNAIVGSLETQLVTASPSAGTQVNAATAVNQNHVNSAISNGGTTVPTSSTQKHGVTNGGAGESVNILLNNSDPAKSTLASSTGVSHQPVTTNVVNTVVTGAVPASGYINQIQTTTSATPANQSHTNLTPTTLPNKHHEPVKVLFSNNNQTLTTTAGVVNLNNSRVTFPVGTLPNGNVNLVSTTSASTPTLQQQQQHPTVLNAVTSSVQSVVSSVSNVNAVNKQQTGVIGNSNSVGAGGNTMVEAGSVKQTPQQQPTLVIKTNNPVSTTSMTGVMTVPITTMAALSAAGGAAGTSGMVTLKSMPGGGQAMLAAHPGGTTMLPGNVQLLNVNTVRPGGPGGPGQKGIQQRVVIGAPHMIAARPGTPGQITLSALQGLQPGTQGHLLLKTENGQYQLLRVGSVGPAAPTTPAAAAITPTGSPATPTTTYRLQVPVSNTPRPMTPLQQHYMSQPYLRRDLHAHTIATTGSTSTVLQTVTAQPGSVVAQTAAAVAQAAPREFYPPHTDYYRQAVDSTKEKCRKFLANLLELSSREPKQVEKNVRTLIQELIDSKVEPEEFCDRLERLLNASPQPCLIGFLKKSLPLLRQALITKELSIEGIKPPQMSTTGLFCITPSGMMVPQLQARGALQQTHLRPTGQPMGTTQVRVVSPMVVGPMGNQRAQVGAQVMPGMARAPHTTMQRHLVTVSASGTPVSTAAAAVAARTKLTALSPMMQRPHLNAQGKMQQAMSTVTSATAAMPHTAVTMTVRHPAPTLPSPAVPKSMPVPKETKESKEKKTFSSSGYTGDDDINDVAAMGGVNLAEESQRILGSTEFVGTQIRSCKDDIFLNSSLLQLKIKKIMADHGLDETTNPEVVSLVSHATQERLKTLVEKLAVIAEHRLDVVKMDPRYEVVQDVKSQLRFLEDLDRMERRRHEEQERELLLRAAKSRSKSEDPEQAKLKAKAKEMQRAEMEELRQREANLTALQAIGPRKKPKLDLNGSPGSSGMAATAGPSGSSSNTARSAMPLRPRVKRVILRDLLFLLEQERETCRTPFLYKAYLK